MDHYVVVLEFVGDRAVIADPLEARPSVWSRRRLETRWRRVALVVEPKAVSPQQGIAVRCPLSALGRP